MLLLRARQSLKRTNFAKIRPNFGEREPSRRFRGFLRVVFAAGKQKLLAE